MKTSAKNWVKLPLLKPWKWRIFPLSGSSRTGFLLISLYMWNSNPHSCAATPDSLAMYYIMIFSGLGQDYHIHTDRIAHSCSYPLHLTAIVFSSTDALVAQRLVLYICNLTFLATLNVRRPDVHTSNCQTLRLQALHSGRLSGTNTAFCCHVSDFAHLHSHT